MNNIPWIEKYRPTNINKILSHDNIINTLNELINNNTFQNCIFYGSPGIGKTSTILCCVKRIYGSDYKSMILELNGSDDRGIKIIREKIKEFSGFNNLFQKNKLKLVILGRYPLMTAIQINILKFYPSTIYLSIYPNLV